MFLDCFHVTVMIFLLFLPRTTQSLNHAHLCLSNIHLCASRCKLLPVTAWVGARLSEASCRPNPAKLKSSHCDQDPVSSFLSPALCPPLTGFSYGLWLNGSDPVLTHAWLLTPLCLLDYFFYMSISRSHVNHTRNVSPSSLPLKLTGLPWVFFPSYLKEPLTVWSILIWTCHFSVTHSSLSASDLHTVPAILRSALQYSKNKFYKSHHSVCWLDFWGPKRISIHYTVIINTCTDDKLWKARNREKLTG